MAVALGLGEALDGLCRMHRLLSVVRLSPAAVASVSASFLSAALIQFQLKMDDEPFIRFAKLLDVIEIDQ